MKFNEEIALKTAEFLLQIKAIKLNNAHPFTWASGRKSPIYCDNRVTLSYPIVRTFIRQQFVNIINEEFGTVELIAGVATGGIAQGVLVAQDLGLSFAYVRSEEKKHGLSNQIEGVVHSGQSVVVVEDLVSTGKSSLNVVKSLQEAECNIKGMIAIFTYGLQIAEDSFKAAQLPLITLTDYNTLIKVAVDQNYIKDDDLISLNQWRENPELWSENKIKEGF
ncbi:MAG: orotate phosphoribosyltransferase [Bacteroidales bacterium]